MKSKTASGRKSVFSKTGLNNYEQSLTLAYGKEKATLIFDRATSILNCELNHMNDRGNKAVRKHLSAFILPGFAGYKALKESGIHSDEAFDFVRKELNKTASRKGKFMNKFQHFPFAFEILRLAVKPIINYGFPKEGWTVIWKENSSKRIAFDMISCLYCEELKVRNALELCPAFCETDHVSYDPLSPKIVFKRDCTLAQPEKKVCDFCFEKNMSI
jgi:L-2-amino-thiazoline-4-carboxylic acid hydrolase